MILQFHNNPYVVISNAFDMIPNIKDGKISVDALQSYFSDMKVYKAFKNQYLTSGSKQAKKMMIKRWNWFIIQREEEDYISHSSSKNKGEYSNLRLKFR